MPRQLKIPTRELGDLLLYVIYQRGDAYEPEWKPLQGYPITTLFTTLSKVNYDHALKGWTYPLVKALGRAPHHAIIKLPVENAVCFERARCPLYTRAECIPRHKKMPWCFQPDGYEDPLARRQAAEVIRLLREQVYIVVVLEPETSIAHAARRR